MLPTWTSQRQWRPRHRPRERTYATLPRLLPLLRQLPAEPRTRTPGPGRPLRCGLESRLPLGGDLVLNGDTFVGGREEAAVPTSPESERREELSFPPGITPPVWVIPKGSRRFSPPWPNSLVPISPSEAALSLCYISG